MDIWPEGEWGNSLAQLMLLRLKASPEDCRYPSPGHQAGTTTHRMTGLHFIISEIMLFCGFLKERQRFSEKKLMYIIWPQKPSKKKGEKENT